MAEIRRLHRAEKLPKKQIAEKLGVSRTTVYKALASDEPPKYQRKSKGSLVDAVLPEVHKLLKDTPRMPATVVAERIGWEHSLTILKDKIGHEPRVVDTLVFCQLFSCQKSAKNPAT